MKIAVVGTGYVGLVSGTCLAEIGHEVVCIDNNVNKIESLKKGIVPIYELGLEDILDKNIKNNRLFFSVDLNKVKESEAILFTVGTPCCENDGSSDLSYLLKALEEVALVLEKDVFVIIKSTVPIGTCKLISNKLKQMRPDLTCEVISNPEFLREGVSVSDFMNPNRIIIGTSSQRSCDFMKKLYSYFIDKKFLLLFSNIETAELIKYSSNVFLANKIALVNEISDICEVVGADIDLVVRGVGADERIGNQFMKAGPGYGGSCFPKDTLAFFYMSKEYGVPSMIIDAVIASNENRKLKMVSKIEKILGGVHNKVISIMGLAFKAGTNDVRDSLALYIIPNLIKKGAVIQAYDPKAVGSAKEALSCDVKWCRNIDEAMTNAEIVVFLTEWDEFKKIDFKSMKLKVKQPIIVDLRNIIDFESAISEGFECFRIGKG